ncbi:hypothetical protein RI845_07425 [Thalassotalea nanhaiensis]|uniref:Uncharacterized protein n=1 Tax=Thalassotalea nanhaiensis TaxID=3065648 RepID=A0ABY9TNR3_9GAMM|nr:hypothetical protein RI845_07425 [Colwelliaceae bacterium SQ345]
MAFRIFYILFFIFSISANSSEQDYPQWISEVPEKGMCTLKYHGSTASYEDGEIQLYMRAVYFGKSYVFSESDILKGAKSNKVFLIIKVIAANEEYPISDESLELKLNGNRYNLSKLESEYVEQYKVTLFEKDAERILSELSNHLPTKIVLNLPMNPEFTINVTSEFFEVNNAMFNTCTKHIL